MFSLILTEEIEGWMMSTFTVKVSDLRDKKVKELTKFLESRVNVEINVKKGEIILNFGEEPLSKDYLRVLLRKYLHKAGLKKRFRLISDVKSVFIVKERKRSFVP